MPRPVARELRVRPFLVALLVAAAGLAGALSHTSQSAVAQSVGSRLVLTHLTPTIGPGADQSDEGVDSLTIRVLVYLQPQDLQLTDVDLVVETFGRITSRSRLHQALGGDITSVRQVIERETLIGPDGSQPGEVVGAEVVLAADRLAAGGQAGVYPVQLSVVQGTTVLDQLVTAAVYLDETPHNPLRTVMVWPITSAPSSTLDGTIDDATLEQLRPGGRLASLLDAMEATSARGVVVEVAPHLLDALQATARDAGGGDAGSDTEAEPDEALAATSLERLRALVATAPFAPVAGPRADADLSALVTSPEDLGALAGRLATGGRDDLVRLTGRTPEPSSFLSIAPLSPPALDLLPGQHLLVPYDHVEGPDPRLEPDLPPATRTVRGASGRELVATVADPYVAERLAQPVDPQHGPVAAVQGILVETAMIHFERPGVADRPLLMLPPRDWSPGDAVAHRLATLLPRSPWLHLVDSFGLTEAGVQSEGTVTRGVPGLTPTTVESLARTLARLQTARETLVEGGTAIAGHPTEALEDAVSRAASVAWAGDPTTSAALLEQVEARIDAAYGSIEVPTGSGITLTAEEVPIPVTIRRQGGQALRVEVEVVSRGSLDFPNGSVQRLVLEPDSSQTVSFVARSRSRGTLPVTVIVRSVAGDREFTRASLTVNSQVVSRPALIAVAAVVVLLLLLGRRRRRPTSGGGELVVVPGGSDSEDGEDALRGPED